MKRNKIVVAMAAAAFMSSMGAVAAEFDSFVASFNIGDDITINGLTDVTLTAENAASDGSARGSTAFCVGRAGVGEGSLPYTVTVTTDNVPVDNVYQLTQGEESIGYDLYWTEDDTFDETKEILPTADNNEITGNTELSVDECNSEGKGAGHMWVRVPAASIDEATTGTYDDIVTMTVAAN